MDYKVHEIFLSLQGEGHWVGSPMCFVRLWGCNLDCGWCDTQQDKHQKLSEADILEKVRKVIAGTSVKRICITGGEPTIYDLQPLTDALSYYRVHLETNGTRLIRSGELFDWITVSPKFPPGLDRTVQYWGNELKVPVWSGVMDRTIKQCASWGHFCYRYLQPVDSDELQENAKRCLSFAAEDSIWRVSMQGHKRLGIC